MDSALKVRGEVSVEDILKMSSNPMVINIVMGDVHVGNEINQDIKNSGNFMNSNGDNNHNHQNITIVDDAFGEAKGQVQKANIPDDEKIDAIDFIETAEVAYKEGAFEKANRMIGKVSDIVKSIPAVVKLIELIGALV